jgi:hypothetical protein
MRNRESDERDEAMASEFMSRVANLRVSPALPNPAYLWCRARLLQRQPDRPPVRRFLSIVEGSEIAACAVAAAALCYSSWLMLSGFVN